MEDGSRQRVNVIAAMVTGVCRSAAHSVVLALSLALLAIGDAVRPSLLFDVFQTGVIGRKITIEVFDRVFLLWWDALSLLLSFHGRNILPYVLLVVKG